MTDIRIILDALNELVTQKASSPFVLKKTWWRSLVGASVPAMLIVAAIFLILMVTSFLMILMLGVRMELVGIGLGAGVLLFGADRLNWAGKEATVVSEDQWDQITDFITNIATIRPEMATELKPLALCLRNNTLNTVWSEDVIEQLNALMASVSAENRRQKATQQLNAILNVQTTSDSPQETETIVITDKELIEDKSPPVPSLASEIRL